MLRHSHRETREEKEIPRRGGKFEIDAEVLVLASQAGETVRLSDHQNQSLQPLEDESDPIPPRDPPSEREIVVARGGGTPTMIVPNMPTPEEHTRHEVGHMPYAAWCRSFVAGKGKADGHFWTVV